MFSSIILKVPKHGKILVRVDHAHCQHLCWTSHHLRNVAITV